uniref:Uncharacterized protein n=1 Tax=Cucumis melo TaxID=3656 RepID=A0A9I9CCQ5_CUCME
MEKGMDGEGVVEVVAAVEGEEVVVEEEEEEVAVAEEEEGEEVVEDGVSGEEGVEGFVGFGDVAAVAVMEKHWVGEKVPQTKK